MSFSPGQKIKAHTGGTVKSATVSAVREDKVSLDVIFDGEEKSQQILIKSVVQPEKVEKPGKPAPAKETAS